MLNEKILYISQKYNINIARTIENICKNIKSEFDISIELIDNIINDQETQRLFIFIEDQLKYKMISDYKNDNNIYSSNELCGKVNKIYNNGYYEYCNIHKYDHNIDDHKFIEKTTTQLKTENIQLNKEKKYYWFINTLYYYCYNIFIYILYTKSESINNYEKNNFVFKELNTNNLLKFTNFDQ